MSRLFAIAEADSFNREGYRFSLTKCVTVSSNSFPQQFPSGATLSSESHFNYLEVEFTASGNDEIRHVHNQSGYQTVSCRRDAPSNWFSLPWLPASMRLPVVQGLPSSRPRIRHHSRSPNARKFRKPRRVTTPNPPRNPRRPQQFQRGGCFGFE